MYRVKMSWNIVPANQFHIVLLHYEKKVHLELI